MNLSDIDFAGLYRRQMQLVKRQDKTPEYWDGRAPAVSQRMGDSDYVR
jgi:ABC-type amino acid transport substrate-binding protein